MSNEQRENNLSRRRENYRRRKEQEKQAQTSRPINSQSRVPFQNFINMTFPRSHIQGTHDSEVDPSRITHVNDVALDRNCTSSNQRNNTSQSDTDDMDVNEAFEDAVISYVNMDARENGALSRRPQAEGKHFRQHIRSYNHVLSFTSIGVHVDENILASDCGIYTFRAQDSMDYGRDINVIRYDGNLKKVQEIKGYYDHLQYPVLFPFGTHGWDINTTNCNGRRVSYRTYYSYMLQIRPNDQSMLLNVGRLLQQYVVDNYVKIESGRLRCIKEHQSDIRSELYQGLHDALHVGETNAENIGKRTILPSSFIGGRRDMTQRYEDGMAIVLNGGKPDIFLIMTCNPSWSEITSKLLPFQTPQDRPDLITRVFHSKFEKLKDDVINKGVLGKVKSYMYITEFQKRGLPHVHMLLVLESNDKLRDPKDYDSMVRTEIPKLECEPQLHEAVVRHMIHGPCGIINQKSPCMKDGHCKKRYPKQFLDETRQGTDSYPEYRRRFDEYVSLGKDRSVDNRWVVPYNPWLLLKYDCHINVETCSSIRSIKYLYKYVYKDPDRVDMEVHKGSYIDEVQQYVDARWICAPEALWKIFRFTLYRLYPSVERLHIHLPNRHQVCFYDHQQTADVLNNECNSKIMLTQFFALNLRDPQARKYLYRDILEHYCWNKRYMEWYHKRSTRKVIRRIYTVSPSEGDKFYLRLLLSHVTGPTSWEYLLTNNGMTFSTFKKSVEDRGFLETDYSIRDCLVEATSLRMSYVLRRLFVTILIFCEPNDVRGLWNEFFTHMVEDYQTTNNVLESDLTNMLLKDLNELLNMHSKKIEDYDLPYLPSNTIDRGEVPSIIQEELAIDIPNEDIESIDKLNNDQMIAFNTIMNVIVQKYCGVFFVDGPGGTELHGWDAPYMVQRAILTPTNDDVQKLNDMIIDQFLEEGHNLLSFDEVEGDNHNLYQQEFLNSIAQGSNAGKRAFLPRIKIKTSASDRLPFVLSRNSLLCD
ncbi:hypothetical protein KIW84_015297 [Lathyrus oleraceus]|uniref:Helitron helicase-like domain-containing protein n=1 Tax=Pisum sativum TaxID=3888 RepID=A0A9D5BQJ7_PEA|nr:hypothetical protein KIW84_015297 [Pisum sativum]